MNSKPVDLSFTPADNLRLANLCGVLDENLRQIEAAFDVAIARRGTHFRIQGAAHQMRQAADALHLFYRQAANDLSTEDVQLGLIEIAKQHSELPVEECVVTLKTRKADLHGRTPRQNQYIKQIQAHDLSFGIGPAGTGKTFLAVACAVDALARDAVERLVLVRPAVEAGERLGFLPGDLVQKVDPFLRPLYDALYELMGVDLVTKLFECGTIEVAPLAFMRGRTLNHSFIILDEAQNTTPEQMKMFLTRIGFGSKAVITGDVTQIDLARGQRSGLVEVRDVLAHVRDVAFTSFLVGDVVRHPLVQRIISAYETYEKSRE